MTVENVEIAVTGGTPTGSSTVTLLDTFTALLGQTLETFGLERYQLRGAHDQAGTIQVSSSQDGTTYDIIFSQAIAVPAVPVVADIINVLVHGRFIRVQWVNGGVSQTVWRLNQKLTGRAAAVA